MSTSNRQALMWVLLLLLITMLFLGMFGIVEVFIWLALLAAWITAFFTWAIRGPKVNG